METINLGQLEARKEELLKSNADARSRHRKPVLPIVFMGIFFFVGFILMMIFIATLKVGLVVGGVICIVVAGIFMIWMFAIINGNKPLNATIMRNNRELRDIDQKIEFCYKNQPNDIKVVNKPAPKKADLLTVSESGDKIVFSQVRGMQKVLDVYEDRVVLTQIQNLRSFFTHDLFKGSKEIYFADMTSIQVKIASGLILGYIQFEVPGIRSTDNFTSENSWTYDTSLQAKANEIAAYVRKRISDMKKARSGGATIVQNQTSSADEILKFKKLLDDGVITQEEFDAKKKALLEK